jgi:two-component system KDP operon response regulator KdpE
MPIALAIDDEVQIRRLLRMALESKGYKVFEAGTGQIGLQEAVFHKPDVILLDLGLPDMDGVEVLKRLREWSQVPVLILSVRDQESVKIAAFAAGADDYVTKPFSTAELLARLRAIMRRNSDATEEPTFCSGPLEVDLAARIVRVSGEEVKLTAIEYALLRLLIKHAGKVVTQKQLLREVWGPQAEDQSHYLRVHFTHLRQKIDPGHTGLIQTEPRIGYRLVTK